MGLFRGVLLGAGAALVSVGAVQAADLPSAKAAPVEYVRICDAYGSGYFFIPGTQTCLKIGGRVRVDYDARGRGARTDTDETTPERDLYQRSGFYNRSYIDFDARTPSAWGTVRAYARMRLQSGSGTMEQENAASLEAAFVQFAGFTFGQATQPFAFMSSWSTYSNWWTGWPNGVRQLSYTHIFGGGISATIAVTDGTSYNFVGSNEITDKSWENHPVYVASLNYNQSWGRLQLMGAYTGEDNRNRVVTKDGWAIGAGAAFNLPMLARGSELQLTAVVWDGLSQLGLGTTNLRTPSTGSYGPVGPLFNSIDVRASDGWSIGGQLRHYWVPTWRSQIYAAYASMDRNSSTTGLKIGEATAWNIGKGLIWSPVSRFDIGVEVLYLRAESKNLAGVTVAEDSNWVSRLRVERTF
jgi:hypothetical protein